MRVNKQEEGVSTVVSAETPSPNNRSPEGQQLPQSTAYTFRTHHAKLKELTMKTSPWHSILSAVHHNNTNCDTGNNIERENRREGTGNKPLCQECSQLS